MKTGYRLGWKRDGGRERKAMTERKKKENQIQ
jgi:hypothetical protein